MDVNASSFKANCLRLLDVVRKHGTEIVITKRGKPVARLVPVEGAPSSQAVIGALRGAGRSIGDIVGPSEAEWNLDA